MTPKTLVTHNSNFHSDDVFACATLQLLLDKKGESYEVIRTRDEDIVSKGNFVFDVGGEHDPSTDRFDHHQHGGAGKRENGIPYASFGLVWQKYGSEICDSEDISKKIDMYLVSPIDANDNGVNLADNIHEIIPFRIQDAVHLFRATWKEDPSQYDIGFLDQVSFAKKLLKREIKVIRDNMEAEEIVRNAYEKAEDKRLIIFDGSYPWRTVLVEYPEPLFVISYKKESDTWRINAIPINPYSYENRKNLPKEWAGLRDSDLRKVTGVEDAIFCHNGLFLAVAKSKKGVLKLGEEALK